MPIDGYAMGWRVPAGCERAEMAFAPDSLVRAGYLVSLPFLLAMLGLVLVRRPPEPEPLPDELPEPPAERMPAGARGRARARSPAPCSASCSPPAPRR